MKLVSIIVPNFNKEGFIAQTITSVLNQTYQNWEMIVVDDNSFDNSTQIIEEFAQNDRRITLIKFDENKGANRCRNVGMEQSKGDYLVFLDADDLLEENCLENRVRKATENPAGNLWVFGMQLFKKELNDDSRKWLPTTKNPLKDFLQHNLPWQTMQPLWKRDFVLRHGGFDETFERLQDVEFHTRALIHPDLKIYQFPEIIDCYYRIDETRRNFDMFEFLNRRAKAVSLYCNKFEPLLSSKDKGHMIGTVIQTYWNLIYYMRNQKITQDQFNESKRNLFGNAFCANITSFKRRLLFIYFIYNYKFPRIPGINKTLEKLIINL